MVARRRARAAFEELAESIPHIVWLADADGSTDYFNEIGTGYTGQPRQANYGWGWVDMVHGQDAGQASKAWAAAARTATPYELEYRIRRHDGAFRWHAFRALPVRGDDGRVERWIGTATDMHDAVSMADRLHAIEKQTEDALALLGTMQSPGHGFGDVESVVRRIRTTAALAQSPVSRRGRRSSSSPLSDSPGADAAALPEAERDIICLIALGYTNREAANFLAVSLRTVEIRRRRAMQALGLRTRAELVRFALDAGLVTPP